MRRKNQNHIKKQSSISWWKLVAGILLICMGLMFGFLYISDRNNMLAAVGFVFTVAPGALLLYMGLKPGDVGFSFQKLKGKKYTGGENAILIFARRDPLTNKDVPVLIKFVELLNPPKGARLHYFRNFKRHYYELHNNTSAGGLQATKLPDKRPFPPEAFNTPAMMQPYKDYMEYSPPSMLQKIAPGILLAAMALVGLLMVMTGG